MFLFKKLNEEFVVVPAIIINLFDTQDVFSIKKYLRFESCSIIYYCNVILPYLNIKYVSKKFLNFLPIAIFLFLHEVLKKLQLVYCTGF